jgi:hypothetical protein
MGFLVGRFYTHGHGFGWAKPVAISNYMRTVPAGQFFFERSAKAIRFQHLFSFFLPFRQYKSISAAVECVCGFCVCCVVWVLIPFYYLLNIMMRSSPAFSRKKF